MEIDFYEILQVSPRAEAEVIEAAYRRLAIKYHPDRNRSADAAERMKALNQAYAVLKDPVERARYDRKRQSTSYVAPASSRPAPKPAAPSYPTPKPPTPPPPTPPKDPLPKAAYAESARDVFVSEALVADSIQILNDTSPLTIAVLQRRLGIGEPRAGRLLDVLIARGIIDRKGNKSEPSGKKGTGTKTNGSSKAEDLSSLVPEVLKLFRTEKTISVDLLQEKFQLGFARATALYQLLSEQELVDKAGKPTSATRARLATKDLGAAFACPFCEQAFVHHYQTHKRLLPDPHYFKCPNCLTEFEQVEGNLYKLVQVPPQYALLGTTYKNRSFSPSQWRLLLKATERADQ